MLTKLFGKKSDHPMADVKTAQAVLDDLPRNDALKLVTELTDWIESVADFAEGRLADQFAVLSLLDETAQVYARKLAYEFFTLADMQCFQGNRLHQALASLFRQSVRAYYSLFERYARGDKGSASINASLMGARWVRAMHKQLKYSAVRYEAADEDVWLNLALLYRHAEQQHYLDTPVNLYSASSEPVSVRQVWAEMLAWQACGVNSMKPRNMHLAERVIACYGKTIRVSDGRDAETLLGFDLQQPRAPQHFGLEATAHPLMRYISMAEMQSRLDTLTGALKKNILPQELGLGAAFTAEWLLDAVKHVSTHLFPRPRRLYRRREFNTGLAVVVGLENIWACCQPQAPGVTSEQWTLENASLGGICAVMSGRGSDGAGIAMLLGMQSAAGAHWGVAIVRRLARDTEGRLRVGAEILSNQASEVMLHQSKADGYDAGGTALWLHAKAGEDAGRVRLLMQAERFSLQHNLKATFEGREYLLIPDVLLEKGQDYDLAGFKVVEYIAPEEQE